MLTDRQRAFLDAYLADPRRHATRAARTAGYAWPDKQGSRLRMFPAIAEAIRAEDARIREDMYARREAESKAEDARAWRAMPAWYRLGLPRPKGVRGRYRKRRKCM
jgi:phage terminase small subunit